MSASKIGSPFRHGNVAWLDKGAFYCGSNHPKIQEFAEAAIAAWTPKPPEGLEEDTQKDKTGKPRWPIDAYWCEKTGDVYEWDAPFGQFVKDGIHTPECVLRQFGCVPVRKVGVLQPIVVRPDEEGYAIVCGERRYRAAALAGLETIPAIVREMDDSQALEAAIVENLQREDVDPMEEADGFRALIASGSVPKGTLTVGQLMGSWPGNETDEEIAEVLARLRG